jgi:hypothetical protein
MVNYKSREGFVSRVTIGSEGSLLAPHEGFVSRGASRGGTSRHHYVVTFLRHDVMTSLLLSSKGGSIADHFNHNPITR